MSEGSDLMLAECRSLTGIVVCSIAVVIAMELLATR
jgi:hypothetical protein